MAEKKHELIPFFDAELFPRHKYKKTEASLFYKDFLIKGSVVNCFDRNGFYDILVAPFFLYQEQTNNTNSIAKNSIQLFHQHFSTPSEYESALKAVLPEIEMVIDVPIPLKVKWDIHYMLLDNTQNSINHIIKKLSAVKTGTYYEYAKAGLQVAKIIIDFVEDRFTKLQLLPKHIYDNAIDAKATSRSWEGNPLAFFTNFFLGNGYELCMKEYQEGKTFQLSNVDQKGSLNSWISTINLLQTIASHSFISDNIKELSGVPKKKYIKEIKSQISILHEVAINHQINKSYDLPQRPFCVLIKRLKKEFKKENWTVDFETEIFNTPRVYEKEFLKKLRNATLTDSWGQEVPLFEVRNKSLEIQLERFLRGRLGNVNQIKFNWKPMQVYYLFFLLKDNKAEFQFKDGEIYPQLLIRNRPFNPANFYPHKKNLFDSDNGWKCEIKKLFI